MRVHRKEPSFKLKRFNTQISSEKPDYELIYENIKNYLAFKISVTLNAQERLVYMDILDYMERTQVEASKVKKEGNNNGKIL
ncbi:MAG TPA: hypothetical protein PLZ08_10825 [Bacillota bacterium]|nr:hypothetical protein [Bacillota bacterium]HOL10633.1 hypothetical protein [Bacillota bacterium]HPO98432.1 hypothetical protein [Bacillota bacterium]